MDIKVEDRDVEGVPIEEARRTRLSDLLSRVPNMAEFSRVSGVHRRMLDRYKAGAEPSLDNAARIAAALNVPLDALIHDIDVDIPRPKIDADVAADAVLIPVIDVVASAGPGIENGEASEIDRLPFSRELLRQLGVRVESAQFIQHKGDSMAPTLADGGICLVDTSKSRPRGDGIYALVVGNELLIKRLAIGAKGLTLISDNAEKYPPETLTGDELGRVKVMGKVFWTGGQV